MALDIQSVVLGDLPIVRQLGYDYNCELDPVETDKEAVVRWISSVCDKALAGKHFFWLAHFEGEIIGFVSFCLRTDQFTNTTYGFIEDFYIVPALRRRGYAQELACAAFAELCRQGAQKIQLDVLDTNKQALNFWQKLGLTMHHHVLAMPLNEPNKTNE